MEHIMQGTAGNTCLSIPTERPFLFFVKKTVHAGDVMVRVKGENLECVSPTCLGESILIL